MSRHFRFGWEWNARDGGIGLRWTFFLPEWWVVGLSFGLLHMWVEKE
jgi:hypothetical protein